VTDSFKDRLNALYPATAPRLTNAQVVEALSQRGCKISTPYLSQLRSGVRTNPSEQVVLALADYFGVAAEYFFGPTPRQDPELIPEEDRSVVEEFEQDSAALPHEIVAASGIGVPSGALSGPSFALEVAKGLPCALTLASADAAFAANAAALLHGGRLRVYHSDDLVGVEIGGAVKNVLAIAVGICDGLGLGQNARAALITRGLAELARLGVALGGRAETVMGLTGAGDLILTATGDLSRNRRVGLELARGKPLQAIIADLGHVAEGVHSARATLSRASACGVEMPIASAVNAVLEGSLTPQQAVELLLARDARAE